MPVGEPLAAAKTLSTASSSAGSLSFATVTPAPRVEASSSFISKLYFSISKGLPHAQPVLTLRTDEHKLVQGVLRMLQGFSSSLFFWDEDKQSFSMKHGIYTSHLSETSLCGILRRFVYSATCLKQVESFVKKVKGSRQRSPTLKAFTNSLHSWLKRLWDVALAEEVKSAELDTATSVTLLELTNSLSSLCSGAEHLVQILYGAIPRYFFESETSVPTGEMAVHILNHLFKKLNDICLLQGGEEEPYHMLLAIFTGSLLPYLEGLDSWLYDGILDDPYEEMFFYANNDVAIDQPAFWERSYLLRLGRKKPQIGISLLSTDGESTVHAKREAGDRESIPLSSSARGRNQNDKDVLLCPIFLKDIAGAIVSAGKSLQLVQHVRDEYAVSFDRSNDCTPYDIGEDFVSQSGYESTNQRLEVEVNSPKSNDRQPRHDDSNVKPTSHVDRSRIMGVLTLSEVFLISLVGLIGDGSHIYQYFKMSSPPISRLHKIVMCTDSAKETGENTQTPSTSGNIWFKFLADTILGKTNVDIMKDVSVESANRVSDSVDLKEMEDTIEHHNSKLEDSRAKNMLETSLFSSSCLGNPVVTVSRELLENNISCWNELNISRNFRLPPLNDGNLREAILGKNCWSSDLLTYETAPGYNGTDYTFGFQFNELEHLRVEDDTKTLEKLYPFPTILPCFQENVPMSEFLPFQKNSTLASRILCWIDNIKLKDTPQPAIIIQECLAFYIKKQVDHVGEHILLKLMNDWKLMDELGVLHAVYLLGSGDLLQHFLAVIFEKLDKGESWDDEFELNTVLQESIRNSADVLLSAPDSLVVSVTKQNEFDDEANTTSNVTTPRKIQKQFLGIDALDLMKFTYKVPWPLDLIANMEALKKYNQVMGFLLKVKRAKFVLDKARRWMWKSKSSTGHSYKHHLLVEQKLLHFVDAFHQYVMDRVFHSAWLELCTGMASASSLDEVIEVHEAYLLSIQRQCFVAPDKLWALIASRVKSILGLALDFYSVQQTLSSGGAATAIKARCEMEVDRIEKQFDECIAFLLRILSFKLNVGHFPHLADLVTRINYNYFYMSSSGNLLTVPSFEAAAKRRPIL